MNCELCEFNNPKATVTAVILKDNKILVLKRNEEPFKDKWDLPGGYMGEGESAEEAIKREIEEELGVKILVTLMKIVPGYAFWKDRKFPVLSHFYLCEPESYEFKLNSENSAFDWLPLKDLGINNLAWDSNQEFCRWLKQKFVFDIKRVKQLVKQLDDTAIVEEQNIYKAVLNGYVCKIESWEGQLIALGWIFPRQTLLRKQAVIEDMIVDEAYRGQGLGKTVLKDLLKWAKEQGCDMVELTTNPKRIAANELYKKEGFKLHPTNHYLYTVDS